MQDPTIKNQLSDTKAMEEVQALDRFYKMLNSNPDRAFYGWGHVKAAGEMGAIDTLLVTDGLFR
jgi:protein pelota